MNKEDVIKRYQNKPLAKQSFGDNKELFVDGFITIEDLLYSLQELNSHELSLTDEGVKFLEEYYGLDVIADVILEDISKGVDYKYKNREDLIAWLKAKGDAAVR